MKFQFHPEAEEEFNEAVGFYEAIEPGLGIDFAHEVYKTAQLCVSFPELWPVIENEIRRALVQRFPYGVLYVNENSTISILAVMHLHRHPDYWKDRKGLSEWPQG